MAITISGNNNNDKILASDGVIDQISGINIVGLLTASHINVGSNIQLGNAGIITATTFVGNVTGNVNSTSPLLLQTGGSERFRITGNNELGIAGANYGSAGQVLTSGGSGSAVTWSTIPQTTINGNVNNRVITGSNTANTLEGQSNLTFDGTTLSATGQFNLAGHIFLQPGGTAWNSTSNRPLLGRQADGELRLGAGSDSSSNITFYTSPSAGGALQERLRIKNNGRVGIGTNNPNALLDVYQTGTGTVVDTIITRTSGGGAFAVQCSNVAAANPAWALRTYSAEDLVLSPGGNADANEKVRIKAVSGYVGINQNNPTCQLQIDSGSSGAGTVTHLELNHKGNDTNDAVKLNFARAGSDIGSIVLEKVSSNNTTDFIFNTRASNTVSESMRITGAGNMGLGCDNPGADPAVGNDAKVFEIRQTTSGTLTTGNNRRGAVLRLKHEAQWEQSYQSSATDDLGRIEFVTGDNSTGEGVRSAIRCRNLQYYNNQALTFEVATANSTSLEERVRITSGGQVVVGGTSSQASDAVTLMPDGEVTAAGFYFSNNIGSPMNTDGIRRHTTGTICIDTASTERLRIASDGTTTVSGTSDGVLQLTTTDSRGAFIRFGQSGSYHNMVGCADGLTSGDKEDLGIRAADNIIFAAGGSSEKLRIDSTGRIGSQHNLSGTADYNRLMLYNPHSGSCWMQMMSTSTGNGANTDGLSIGLNSSNIAHFWLRENADMYFATNNTLRWRITSSGDMYPEGNYKIGLNSNVAFRMSEVNSNKFVHRYGNSGSATNNQQEAIWYGGGITTMHDNGILSTSNYTWGLTGSRGYPLIRIRNYSSGGAIYAESGTISSGSDYRMKENIVEITNGIETVKKLKPSIFNIRKSFNPNDDGKKHHGFIAHEVQEAIPDIGNIVSGVKDGMEEVFYGVNEDDVIPEGKKAGDSTGTFTDKPDYQGIDYGHMTPVLAAAIKELITKVETLESKVSTLEGS